MGKVIIVIGSILCLTGIFAFAFAVAFFEKQRTKLIDQINNEYREA